MKNSSFKPIALLLFIILPFLTFSQDVKINVSGNSFCGFSIESGYYNLNDPQEYITREAKLGDESGIPDVINEIKTTIGISVPIYVYIAKEENNCFATIAEGGKRVIIADHLFLNNVNKQSGTEWAAISILAHEIGHHIAGFNRRSSQLESELDADYWSGYALQKLGASKDASVKCIMRFGTEHDTNTHPSRYSRSKTIKLGWDDALNGSYDPDRCESCD
jgi:hypothetical protein